MFDTLTRVGASGAGESYTIDRALRLHADDSAALSRTPSSSGNRKTWTFSTWIKLAVIDTGSGHCIFSSKQDGSYNDVISITSDNKLSFKQENNNTTKQCYSTRLLRDTTGWYHIVVTQDTEEATAANRVKFWINGVQDTLTGTFPNEDSSGNINWTKKHFIGATKASSGSAPAFEFNGYIAETHFIDGTALDESTFGKTDPNTNAWIPKAVSGVTYGTNGFYLNYSDNSDTTDATLGADTSGNGNNYTPTGLSVAAGTGNDSVIDTPTNNFAVLNYLYTNGTEKGGNPDDGNLKFVADNNYAHCQGTFSLKNGKYYWEVTLTSSPSGPAPQTHGITRRTGAAENSYSSYDGSSNVYGLSWSYAGSLTGSSGDGGTAGGAEGNSPGSYTNGDVLGFASDIPNGTLKFYKDGTLVHTTTGLNSHDWFPSPSGYNGQNAYINFGQIPYAVGSEANEDAPSAGEPPTGYKRLCANSLDEPDVKKSTDHFKALKYVGTGLTNTNAVTGVGFQPDVVICKSRDNDYYSALWDRGRGVSGNNSRFLVPSDAFAEGAGALSGSDPFLVMNSLDSDGFTLGATTPATASVNNLNDNCMAYCWKAGGSTSSNSNGSITSTVSVNDTAGISVGTFTAQSSGSATIGHGLSAAPDMIWSKSRTATANWYVYHKSIGEDGWIYLDDTAAATTGNSAVWNPAPTNSVFTYGSGLVNAGDIVFYAFRSVEGFSKIGSYNAQGNSSNGVFVYLGFKPAYVCIKRKSGADGWFTYDSTREPINPLSTILTLDAVTADYQHSLLGIDFLSNGFKLRASTTGLSSSEEYIYFAFAGEPLKYSTAH